MSSTTDSQVLQLLNLPPELLCDIIELACPNAFEPTIILLALGRTENGWRWSPCTITPDFSLVSKSKDIRLALSICSTTRAMVLRRKPQNITFATRRTDSRNNAVATDYTTADIFTTRKLGILRFNDQEDIVCIKRAYWSSGWRIYELKIPSGFSKHLSSLRLRAGFANTMKEHLTTLLKNCRRIQTLYISDNDIIKNLTCTEQWAIFLSPRICHHIPREDNRVECFIKSPEAIDWRIEQARTGELPSVALWTNAEDLWDRRGTSWGDKYDWVPNHCLILPSRSYDVVWFELMRNSIEFGRRPPSGWAN